MNRTEEDILKDFEKLGWYKQDEYITFMLKKMTTEQVWGMEIKHHCYISINVEKQTYSAKDLHSFTTFEYELTMQEHKLLHELFTCWGWLLEQ